MKVANAHKARLLALVLAGIGLISLFLPGIRLSNIRRGQEQSSVQISLFSLARGQVALPTDAYTSLFDYAKQEVPGVTITEDSLHLSDASAQPGRILFAACALPLMGAMLHLLLDKKRRTGLPIALLLLSAFVTVSFVFAYINIAMIATNVRQFQLRPAYSFYIFLLSIIMSLILVALTDRTVYRQRYLFGMLMPFAVWLFVFAYFPMFGWVLAFKNYGPSDSIFLLPFLSPLYKNFADFISSPDFLLVIRNTLTLNLLFLGLLTPLAVLLALMLAETRSARFRKMVQTVSYLPHFISWVVVASLVQTFFSMDGGIVNTLLASLGLSDRPLGFLQESRYFPALITGVQLWKSVGWESIIYLAAISSVNPDLYEAAMIDGASRLQQIAHVTLPAILPIVGIIIIMNTGWILSGFDPYFLIGSSTNRDWSIVLDTYTFQMGVGKLRYGYATAVGMFKTLLGLGLLVIANRVARKFSGIELLR